MASDFVQEARCRNCGKTTEVIKEDDEQGGSRFIAPPSCPHCGLPLAFDVIGPITDPAPDAVTQEPDTSDQDTRPFAPLSWEQPEAVPVIHVSSAAYGEAHAGGLDLRTVTPTGANSVITVGDVYDALAAQAGMEVQG